MTATFTPVPDSLALWKQNARACLSLELTPGDIVWDELGVPSQLLGFPISVAEVTAEDYRVSRQFVGLARSVACHRDHQRWSMLYHLLWRLTHGESHLLSVASDPLVWSLVRMHRGVKRASHKMKAFVRFRAVESAPGADDEFVAWFEPAHRVVEKTVPFFVDRFRSMKWTILTPDACARWDGGSLSLDQGIERIDAPHDPDSLEDLWRTYYAGIFNPARLNRNAMVAEMPRMYWKNLPEARIIAELSREAPGRMTAMILQTLSSPQRLPADLAATETDVSYAPPIVEDSWDPVHDPGWREARRRAEVVGVPAPRGLISGPTTVVAGVAGWTDPTLLAEGVYYPSGATSAESRLRYYASQLAMVEVDSTYYALPSEDTSRLWVERTPPGFVFNVKAHSLMTGHPTDPSRLPGWLRDDLPQRLRLSGNVYSHHFSRGALAEVWKRFLSALAPLAEAGKFGALMLQYPRWFTPGRESAAALCDARRLLGEFPASIEFRHRDWLSERVAPRTFGLLRDLQF
ncbi:MAG: TIGR03915 family putative DNA repair protein, partial [Gemmatimonadaceae bacterium]